MQALGGGVRRKREKMRREVDEKRGEKREKVMRRMSREEMGKGENSNWQHNTEITNFMLFQSRTCGSPSQR